MQLFAHENDLAYLLLAGLFLAGLVFVLAISWKDSIRALAEFFSPLRALFSRRFRLVHLCRDVWQSIVEFFAPLRVLRRPRFRLIHLFVAVIIASLVARLAAFIDWRGSNGLEIAVLLAMAGCGLAILASFVWIAFGEALGVRPKLRSDIKVQTPPSADQPASRKVPRLRIRFPKTRRQITALKRFFSH